MCENTRSGDIVFMALKKAEGDLQEYTHETASLEREKEEFEIQLNPNDIVKSQLQQLNPLGQVDHQLSFFNISVRNCGRHNVECVRIQYVVFLSNGHVVLACFDDGLKLLDINFQLISKLSMRATKACRVSDTEVLVALGIDANIQFIEVLSRMLPKKAINIGRHCTGVEYYNKEIYVTCHDGPGNGEVRVLDRNGQLQRRLGFDGESYMFTTPVDVKVTRNGDKVTVADWNKDCIICLDQQGQVIYRYTDRDLQTPFGVLLDAYDNLLVCGSNNVHVVSKEGKQHQIILTQTDGILNPICIAYRHIDFCLAVGIYSNDKRSLCTFSTNI